jgi:hypothetical protein
MKNQSQMGNKKKLLLVFSYEKEGAMDGQCDAPVLKKDG